MRLSGLEHSPLLIAAVYHYTGTIFTAREEHIDLSLPGWRPSARDVSRLVPPRRPAARAPAGDPERTQTPVDRKKRKKKERNKKHVKQNSTYPGSKTKKQKDREKNESEKQVGVLREQNK